MISDMPRRPDTDKTAMHARVTKTDLAEVDACARDEMITRSQVVARILRQWADQRRAAKGGKPAGKAK